MTTITRMQNTDRAAFYLKWSNAMQNIYAYHLRAKKTVSVPSLFIWFEAKNDARAKRDFENHFEDAELDAKNYFKPVRTDFPVYDDLPEEAVFDGTWCTRYQLADDQRTWLPIDTTPANVSEVDTSFPPLEDGVIFATNLNRERKLGGAWLFGADCIQINAEQLAEIDALIQDAGQHYFENLRIASVDFPNLDKCYPELIVKVVNATKAVWPPLGAPPAAELIGEFLASFLGAKREDQEKTLSSWQKRTKAAPTPSTPAGAVTRTYDMLELEVALHLLSVNPDEAKASDVRNAKFIIESRDPAWRAWTTSYRTIPGILEIPRGELWSIMADSYKNLKLIEDAEARRDHLKVMLFGHPMLPDYLPESNAANPVIVEAATDTKNTVEPEVKSLGNGRFDVSQIFEASPLAAIQEDSQQEVSVVVKDAISSKVEKTEESLTEVFVQPERATEDKQQQDAEPSYFEPGRYLELSNDAYHAANGISSTMLKDARVSLMYYNARHVAKTIKKEKTKFLDMGNLVHTLVLEPEKLDQEFSIEPAIPKGAFTGSASMRAFIDEHNASLPKQADLEVIKAMLEAHNATLPTPYALGGNVDEIGQFNTLLPTEFQTIPEGQKFTATLMKACIKEFNATLPEPLKVSGSREALLEQLATIEPEWVEEERALPLPLAVSGSKDEMAARIRGVKPDAVFADELLDAWRNADDARIQVTLQQMEEATAIQQALFSHPSAGPMIKHANRTVEASYFGFDEDTGLEIRVRPDLEIDLDGVRLGFDLKTISMWNVKQHAVKGRLHREIIDRDYHLSAAMYSDVAAFDQFFWIFVNKDEGYNWVAIVEASTDLLELGRLEYKKTMRDIQHALDTGVWPAPITDEFIDELNDFDQRRLEALRIA